MFGTVCHIMSCLQHHCLSFTAARIHISLGAAFPDCTRHSYCCAWEVTLSLSDTLIVHVTYLLTYLHTGNWNWNCCNRPTRFVVIWKHFCFILSTGSRIRIDSVMRPRSSSRGRNTSASVTVTGNWFTLPVYLWDMNKCSCIVILKFIALYSRQYSTERHMKKSST